MRCAPHLASSKQSQRRRFHPTCETGQGRTGQDVRKWLVGMPQTGLGDVCTSSCQSAKPPHHHPQRQHAPSGLQTPVGDIRKEARNSPIQGDKRVQLSSDATFITLHQQGIVFDITPLKHATYQGSSPPSSKEKRGDMTYRQVVFPVGLLMQNVQTDGRTAGGPSLHWMPSGPPLIDLP